MSLGSTRAVQKMLWVSIRMLAGVVLVLLALGCTAQASNPRWVTGPPYFTSVAPGLPVIWYTRTPLYYTDPGDLSQYVDHATADALVSAAASVWNVTTADFVIAQGGELAEHVNGDDSYVAQTGVVFPSDVQASNHTNIQIAVIYDSDGSVTDLLLGQGASAPLECGQNAVTESVDQIATSGQIQHAVIVLNGRCTGPAQEQQLQMQYQLMRAFGRVFGVGWSQTNDNVFTQNPVPTALQANHWPIMHPIDIVCGPYTYQCLPQPFTLRDDDLAGISQLYPIGYTQEFGWVGFDEWLPGKQGTFNRAADVYGTVNFPNGQGMAGVNLEVQRLYMFWPVPEAFADVSGTTGFRYQQIAGNPVNGAASGIAQSMGSSDPGLEGWFDLGWIPMIADTEAWVDVLITTEPINPLYTGAHAVGPYPTGTVTPSGVSTQQLANQAYPDAPGYDAIYVSITPTNSIATCGAGADGTGSSPAVLDVSGWWTDVLCGRGHSAWSNVTVASGHTATVEVTTLDDGGEATENKMRPQIGFWNASDPAGTTPTYAYTSAPFNTMAFGTTGLTVDGTTSGALRMVITDARGDGRPDYAYKARMLYAASFSPSAMAMNGAPFTITRMGFRAGNEVLINGVPATVASWTTNTITGVAPPASAFATAPSGPVDVTVRDLQTGGTTTISGALTYTTQAGDLMLLVSAPTGTTPVEVPATPAFAVRVLLPDGVTPVQGAAVQFGSSGAAAQIIGRSANPCVVITDSTGLASVAVLPTSAGDITLSATAVGTTLTTTFHAQSHSVVVAQSKVYVAAGSTVNWTPVVTVLQDTAPIASVAIQWSGSAGLSFGTTASTSGADGSSAVTATAGPLNAAQTSAGSVCGWPTMAGGRVCTSLSVQGVDPAVLSPTITSGAGQSVHVGTNYSPLELQIVDPSGHPVGGAAVSVYQTVDQAQMPCPTHGACAPAPQLSSTVSAAVSDINGMVAITPLSASVPAVTHIAATTGAQGFVSLSLTQTQ